MAVTAKVLFDQLNTTTRLSHDLDMQTFIHVASSIITPLMLCVIALGMLLLLGSLCETLRRGEASCLKDDEMSEKSKRMARKTVTDEPDIQFILFKRRNGLFKLAACRGQNKGCDRMRRAKKPQKPCPDCYICEDETMTLGEVQERLRTGDA